MFILLLSISICLIHVLLGHITRMAGMGADVGAGFVAAANLVQGVVAVAGAAAVV
jgi:hypothetical protein